MLKIEHVSAGSTRTVSALADATSSTREPSALDLLDRDDSGECCTHAEYLSTCHSRGVSAPNPAAEKCLSALYRSGREGPRAPGRAQVALDRRRGPQQR